MTSANDPSLPPDKNGDESIPLPPIPPADYRQTTPEQLATEIARLDWGLAAMVLILGFLLASFAVRNSDFWEHLATGRLYAHGQFNFGIDPFTYTTGYSYWANHAWLFDWILYGLTRLFGGPDTAFGGGALVVIKALLITALAWFMLKTRRPGLSLWAPAFCTALALLSLSPRLHYQPTLVSMLFLSLTLYILQRPRHEETDLRNQPNAIRSPLASYWLLVPLFALWVNTDSWFLLGAVTVALFLLGQVFQRLFAPVLTGEDAPEPGQLRTLALVLGTGLAACFLINPYVGHLITHPQDILAFSIPAPLSPLIKAEVFQRDLIFQQLFYSPLGDEFFRFYGQTITNMAYFPLLGLGLLSFVLSFFQGWRWWRFLIWLAFALLSAYQIRNIPFFAVVAGPITALNLQDFAARQFGREPRVEPLWKAWSLGGRIATILVVLVLLLAAWPGWLHGRPTDARSRYRVAWTVEVDPSLRQTAEQLRKWRTEGLLQAGENGFNYGPDILNYCAWYCADDQGQPLEKGFFDYRIQAFPQDVAKQYVDTRQVLRTMLGQPADSAIGGINWQNVLRKHNVNHVILNRGDPDFLVIWQMLLLDWDQWTLLYQDGRSCIFHWRDPRAPAAAAAPRLKRFDPNPLAFGPKAERAPEEGPGRAPIPQDIYSRYLHGLPPPTLDGEEAERYLEYYNLVRTQMTLNPSYLRASAFGLWAGTALRATTTPANSTVAMPGMWATQVLPMEMVLKLAEARAPNPFLNFYLAGQDYGPAAAPLLAVRAARRGIKANPDDAQAYFNLARAYNLVLTAQEEHWTGRAAAPRDLNPRQKLRQVQMVAALEHGLKLRPDDPEAHEMLFQAYFQAGYHDLALDHLRDAVKYGAAAGQKPGDTRDTFKTRIENMQRTLKNFDAQVTRQRNEYDISATNQALINKARIALSKQLGKKALDLLLDADPAAVDIPEATLELFLLLSMGRPEDARRPLEDPDSAPGLKEGLGANYDWYWLLIAAADGNYKEAGDYLDVAIAKLEKLSTESLLLRLQMQTFMGQGAGNLPAINTVMEIVHQIANYRVMRGMLLLEEGDPAAAARFFQQALDMNNGQPWEFESRGIAVHYLKHIRAAQPNLFTPKGDLYAPKGSDNSGQP
jgi:hypothetical protein